MLGERRRRDREDVVRERPVGGCFERRIDAERVSGEQARQVLDDGVVAALLFGGDVVSGGGPHVAVQVEGREAARAALGEYLDEREVGVGHRDIVANAGRMLQLFRPNY